MATRYKSTSGNSLIRPYSDALAIDPGYSQKSGGCACALGRVGMLSFAFFERSSEFSPAEVTAGCEPVGAVIVEQPQQDARSWGVPPAVLIKLAWEGAALAGLYAGASGAVLHCPTVTEWKGTEKKPAHHSRLWAVLAPEERKVLGGSKTFDAIEAACEKGALCRWKLPSEQLYPSSFKTHNLLDAAALLMWAYGRLEKVG